MKIGILGGGLTGLTLAYFLQCEAEVIEKDPVCGGLCRTFTKNGFSYDWGGHIIFSKDQEVLDFMVSVLDKNVDRHYRNNKVLFKKGLVKYPFENGLSEIPKNDNYECLFHFINNSFPKPTNFKEWIYYTFGKGIAEKYLIPYNEKIWNIDIELMGLDWVERVPKPPVEDIIKSAIGIETEGYVHQLYFYYPISGGIQGLIEAIKNKITNVSNNFEVTSISRQADQWVVSNGVDDRKFDRIISTIPIFNLLNALEDVPHHILDTAKKLRYNSLIVVMIGVNVENLSDKTAVYIPDPHHLFHRICFNKYFSINNVPAGKSSIMAEITANNGDTIWNMTDDEIIDSVINSLVEEDFFKKEDVCETDINRTQYAYVIPDLEYSQNLAIIQSYLKDQGIELCGRFAEYKYLNMDACIRSAMDLANTVNKELI
ncbi:FAD-dependent oxidoreductase [Methanospirillum purgamenti]|uniref:FAD-dependent oxidoreductase n=1 Tax=Methanospirillum hungatei TaxID=2203 RepID=A0A8F5VKM6_METHU|nr:FAD-dependent oxidoreductase [Methanospirillum hungatei]QXO93533.1 FAD-dependent oxidoreductase [Methanospirillum hungatei]